MLTYKEASELPTVATVTRPDGYFGKRTQARLVLSGTTVLEIYSFGYTVCPAVSQAADAANLNWLLDHHPNFREFKRV